MVYMQGDIRKTVGSDLLLGSRVQTAEQARAVVRGSHSAGDRGPGFRSQPHHLLVFTTGKLSVSKYLICKMGTGTKVPSSATAWARDEGQSA